MSFVCLRSYESLHTKSYVIAWILALASGMKPKVNCPFMQYVPRIYHYYGYLFYIIIKVIKCVLLNPV